MALAVTRDRADRAVNRTLTAIPGIAVGHAHDTAAATGCTAVLGPFVAAADVRGLATGTREMDALSPLHITTRCDAILLGGGSAFGLAAADGVSRWLEERGRGFPTRGGVVPIVPAAVIYDLGTGRADVRPDSGMGRAAAATASTDPVAEGRVGAGAGATVGKLHGGEASEPAGLGGWAERFAEGTVAALVVVNAFGDVLDAEGRIIAGTRGADGGFLDTARAIRSSAPREGFGAPGESTTLAVVATDAPLGKRELQIIARLAMNGIVRRISPSNTPFDGDVVFAVSPNGPPGAEPEPGEVMAIGLRAQAVLEHAIERAALLGGGEPPGEG
ncbi:MAG: P1 family peptidase [Gemmatimonadota bacterium]